MKIVLVKGEKTLSVKSEFYKSMQLFTETVKNSLFEFDKSSTITFRRILDVPNNVVLLGAIFSFVLNSDVFKAKEVALCFFGYSF